MLPENMTVPKVINFPAFRHLVEILGKVEDILSKGVGWD